MSATCPYPVPNYNPFTVNGNRTLGSDWILPSSTELLPLNYTEGARIGYGCFTCPSYPFGVPLLSNTSANAVRTAEELCPPGFFCPYLNVSNPTTYPVYCPPDADCLGRRLGTYEKCLTPQGYYEPMACPAGWYCPNYNTVVVCPAGSFCPTGAVAPTVCQFMSICPVGSVVEKHYGFFLIVALADILLGVIYLILRFGELRRNKEPFSAVLPTFIAKFLSNPSFKRNKQRNPTTNESAGDVKGKPAAVVVSSADISQIVSENISMLTGGFKKGLEGHDNLKMDYKFEDLSLKLHTGKTILKGVSGQIKSGRMTAIMGPSGAGKTTFMNVLMGKVHRTDGLLKINNIVAEMETYRKIIGYVPQDDIMIPELTVRENLMYSARVRLPQSWSNKDVEDHVDALLKALNLSHVANSRIGSTLERGISGGQKKRVNIGLELAAAPLSIFLDEPTSGLDSTAALDVCHIMSSISRLGLTVVAVIHQPRLEIFEAFDDVLMIAPGGRTAYIGPVNSVQEYFMSLGFVFDPRMNPADVLMDILSGRGELAPGVPPETQQTEFIVEQWESRLDSLDASTSGEEKSLEEDLTDSFALAAMAKISKLRGASFLSQVVLAHNRYIKQQVRLVGAFIMEAFLGALAGAMMGLSTPGGEVYQGIYVEPFSALSGSQDAVFLGLIGMINGIVIALVAAPPGVKIFGEEMAVYYREAAAGHNKLAYFIGKNFSIIYRIALTSAHFTAVYYLMAHPPIYLGYQYISLFLNFFGVYGMAMIVSMLIRRENAPLMAVTVGMIFGVLCGFAPTIIDATQQGYVFLFDIGMNRWSAETLFSLWIERYSEVYDVSIPNKAFGYELGRTARNLGLMLVISIAYRIVAFVLLVLLNRDKQSRATNFNHLQIDTPLSECTLREEYESYEGEFFGSGANRILIVEESERDWFPHDECLPQSSSVLSTAPLHELDHAVNSSKSANFGFHAQTDEDDQQSLLSSEENWKDAEDAMSLLSVDEDWRDSGILGESSAVVGILEHGNTIARHCSARRKSLLRDEDGANVLLGSDELVFVELFRAPATNAAATKLQTRRKKKPTKAAPKHAALLAASGARPAAIEVVVASNAPTLANVPLQSFADDTISIAYEAAPPPSIDGDSVFAELSGVFSRFEELAVAKTAKQEDAADSNDGGQENNALKTNSETAGDDEEDNAEAEAKAIASKKKKKLEQRLSIAQLKQIVLKPDVVEWVDITAANPTLLVHLKSCRNSVPIPIHWQQKRKYLQGKRGIEKSAFDLPDFIKQTGIMDLRQAVKDKEDSAKLKSKQRERVQPKMGKLDIDYQKLHDAFFRWQTKPPLSLHGEMYYEGKEYETKMKFKKPGVLSQELRDALGMGDDLTIAPPWLINMQRYGPPPSYPGLKVPGLNCPIPPGAVWGYQPGGWGKPPVDEYGRPLYGDVFGTMGAETASGGMSYVPQEHVAPIERTLWGELEPEEEPEEVEEEQNEDEEEDEVESVAAQEEPPSSGLVTPSGLSSVPSGLETPEFIELRKESRRDDGPKELYKIIPQKENAIRGFMGSQHTYDMSAAGASTTFAPPPPSSGTTSSSGSAKRKMIPGLITDKPVAMSLNPEDLEDGLSGDAVKRAYEDKMRAARKEAAPENFSDLVAEHAGKMANKRRRKDEEKGKKPSGRDEKFKF
ncbi:hypothetical protein HDU83_005741 [Entophlyctis luteolus]|nr:hypothetical protein HDU83_005741 [Entophlyctis luteolus]